MKTRIVPALLVQALVAASLALSLPARAEVVDVDQMSYTARQLLQIALQDDRRIDYRGLDGVIGPQTIAAIEAWQALEGLGDLEPLDEEVVCTLIKRGIKGHGSSSKLPSICD